MYKAIDKDSLILICGVGSAGERQLKNILGLGYGNIILYRKRNLPLRKVKKEFQVFLNLDEALRQKPCISFICNPTSLHIDTAIRCARAGCHIFIEKPISHSKTGIKKLQQILTKKRKKIMVGYMLRFHPCFKKIREWIKKKMIGKVIFTESEWGEYLPLWHTWEDYRISYAGKRELGGGPTLTLSHDIDLLVWFFGESQQVKALGNFSSNLNINTEHSIDILVRFKGNVNSNIHLDYLQNPPSRIWKIVGDKGKICFNYFQGKVDLFLFGEKKRSFQVASSFKKNHLYIEEIKYFFDCIARDKPPSPGIKESLFSLEIVMRALQSLKKNQEVRTER